MPLAFRFDPDGLEEDLLPTSCCISTRLVCDVSRICWGQEDKSGILLLCNIGKCVETCKPPGDL